MVFFRLFVTLQIILKKLHGTELLAKVKRMLQDIRIFTTDEVWRQILTAMSATIVNDVHLADVNLDAIGIEPQISALELKALILNTLELNQQAIIEHIFGRPVHLSALQMQIVVLLYQTGGMSAHDLRSVLAPNIATHTIDTAIYQLRKVYGRDFVKNENGKYFIGKL